MCRSNGVRHPVSQVKAFLLGLFVVFIAAATSAQEYIPNGTPIPQGIKMVNTTATGVNTSATFSSLFNGVARSHTMPVPVSSGTLGSLTKGALRGAGRLTGPIGWALALRDLVNGVGWAIDELQSQVVDGQPRDPTLAPAGTRMYRCEYDGTLFRSSSAPALLPCMDMVHAPHKCQSLGPHATNPSFWRWYCGALGNLAMGSDIVTQPTPEYGTGHVPSPVTDAQLGDLVKTSPEVVNAVLVDAVTGAPIRTPELVKAMNDLRKALEAAHGTTPGTDVVVNPDYPDTPQEQEGSWPQFCPWASKVCDFVEWFKRDPDNGQDPPIPYESREPEMEEYDSGWGGGSCPAPYSVAVLDGEFEISFAGICGFVEYLRPLVIALAWISSAFIVVGSSPRRL